MLTIIYIVILSCDHMWIHCKHCSVARKHTSCADLPLWPWKIGQTHSFQNSSKPLSISSLTPLCLNTPADITICGTAYTIKISFIYLLIIFNLYLQERREMMQIWMLQRFTRLLKVMNSSKRGWLVIRASIMRLFVGLRWIWCSSRLAFFRILNLKLFVKNIPR